MAPSGRRLGAAGVILAELFGAVRLFPVMSSRLWFVRASICVND